MKVELKDIELPTSWDEINGETLQKLILIETEGKDNIEVVRQYIAAVSTIAPEFIKYLDVNAIEKIYPKISFLFSETPNKNKDNKDDIILTIDGVEHRIFNEDIVTVLEWVELNNLEGFAEAIKNLDTVLPVLLRPVKEIVGGKHILEEYDADMALIYSPQLLQTITAEQVYQVLDFFLRSEQGFLKNSTNSLRKEMVEMEKILIKDGGGTTLSGKLQKKELMEALEKLKKLGLKSS